MYARVIMKKVLTFAMFVLSLQATALEKSEMVLKPPLPPAKTDLVDVGVELDIFGLSYHTNRDYDFNEVNPGVGLSMVLDSSKASINRFSLVLSSGVYTDSYNDTAFYMVAGPRYTLGYENDFHVFASVQGGYMNGSDRKGQGVIPFVGFGYDRFNVCFTGALVGKGDKDAPDASKMVAVFLKIKVIDF